MIPTTFLHWAAGFLEGEGTFYTNQKNYRVSAPQVQLEPLERLLAALGGKINLRISRSGNSGPIFIWRIDGVAAIGLMMTLYPLMSPKRQGQIRRVLALWKTRQALTGNKHKCKYGHPLSGPNMERRPGDNARTCLTCRARRNRTNIGRLRIVRDPRQAELSA